MPDCSGSDAEPPERARLPKGRHGLPREFVAHNQRERLIAGFGAAVAKRGYAKTTIADITREAAVSRRTFYENFDSKEACFLAAYDVGLAQVRDAVVAAYLAEEEWTEAMRSAIATLLRMFAAEPDLARLGLVEGFRAGPVIYDRYNRALERFSAVLRLGRPAAGTSDRRLPETTEEAIVGGVAVVLARRILAGRADRLEELLPDVVQFVLTPYVGAEEAERVATSPAGAPADAPGGSERAA